MVDVLNSIYKYQIS